MQPDSENEKQIEYIRPEPRRFSTMENTVLGIVWKRGPCTTYSVMKELQASTSTFFRDWAGTVYPIVNRLLKSGYLGCKRKRGSRGEKMVHITESGNFQLKIWLTGEVEAPEVAQTVDLLRLRVFYLAAIEPSQRFQFIDDAVLKLEAHKLHCEEAVKSYRSMDDKFSALATEGVIHETTSRIEWLKSLKTSLATEEI